MVLSELARFQEVRRKFRGRFGWATGLPAVALGGCLQAEQEATQS
jgi:hypothetical protein